MNDDFLAGDADYREHRVLAEAAAIRELFGEEAEDAIQRRIASALDDLAVDRAMFLLDVQSALYGLPIGHFSAGDRGSRGEGAEAAAQAPAATVSNEPPRRTGLRAAH